MSSESCARDDIVKLARSLFERGLTHGSTGNISVRVDEGWLMTPTGSSFGDLDPARLSKLDASGTHVAGDAPTKEAFLHRAMYEEQPRFRAVVHLHSVHSVAVSLLSGLDPLDVLPPLTAYYVMRVGRLPMVPYFAPGDAQLAQAVRAQAAKHHAVLLANHGPVAAGTSLSAAADAIEEIEATARIFLMLRHERWRALSSAQVDELRRTFPN